MSQTSSGHCITVVMLLDRYIADTLLRPATIASFRGVVNVFNRDMGSPALVDIDRTMVVAFRDAILKRASATTFNTYLTHLRTIFNYGLKIGIIAHNPFLDVKRAPATKRKKIVDDGALTDAIAFLREQEEIDEAERTLKPAWFWALVVRTLYGTGIRRRQLVSLRWRDVDWQTSSLLLTAEGSKTRREWRIPISAQLKDQLALLRDAQQILVGPDLDDRQIFNVTLFSTQYRGNVMTEFQVSGFFRRLSDRLGKRISSHRLRHTTATHLIRGPRQDIKGVQAFLGHMDVRTTLEYVDTDIEQMRKLLEGLKPL